MLAIADAKSRFVQALVDENSLKILNSVAEPMKMDDICSEQDIPVSPAYKIIAELEKGGS